MLSMTHTQGFYEKFVKRPQDFLNLFLCEAFINRQRAEED